MVADAGPEPPGDLALVVTTIGGMDAAESLVRSLLDERLIACGNILPDVLSIYRWEGAVAREREVVVLLKTAATRVGELSTRIVALHPYAVPEMMTLPVTGAFPPYAQWVLESTGVGA